MIPSCIMENGGSCYNNAYHILGRFNGIGEITSCLLMVTDI